MKLTTGLLAAGAALAIAVGPVVASAESVTPNRGWSGFSPSYPGYPGARVHSPPPGYYVRNPRPHYPHYPGGYYYRDRDNTGAAVAAGIAGLAVGTIIGSAASSNTGTVTYRSAPEPWSHDWYRYCSAKYRSFDPGSGTYLGYDGRRHFCR